MHVARHFHSLDVKHRLFWFFLDRWFFICGKTCAEQGIKLLGLLLTGSTGQWMASQNGLA